MGRDFGEDDVADHKGPRSMRRCAECHVLHYYSCLAPAGKNLVGSETGFGHEIQQAGCRKQSLGTTLRLVDVPPDANRRIGNERIGAMTTVGFSHSCFLCTYAL